MDGKSLATGGPSDAGTQIVEMVEDALCKSLSPVLISIKGTTLTLDNSLQFTQDCIKVLYTRNALDYAAETPGYGLEFEAMMGGSLLCNYIINDEFSPGTSIVTASANAAALCAQPKPCSTDLLVDPDNCGACGLQVRYGYALS
jgi:hypothetical protein